MRGFILNLIVCSALGLIVGMDVVHAQDKSPLKMSMINVSEGGGGKAHNTIKDTLLDNDNVRYVDESRFKSKLDKYAINLKILRKSELRSKFASRLGRMMKKEGLEGLFLLDVYNRGRKLQLVVIGPGGEELANLKKKIQGGAVSSAQTYKLLNSAFRALGPKVLALRKNAAVDPVVKKEKKKKVDIVVGKETPKPKEKGDLNRGLDLAVGVFVGRRQMEVKEGDQPNDFSLSHGSPFVGVGAQVDAVASTFSDGTAGLGLSFFVAYAQFSTIFFDGDTNERQELSSAFTRVGGQLSYIKSLSAKFLFDLYGGGEFISLTIAPNAFYTGNRYISGRAGLGLQARFGDDARLRVHGGVVPVFSADNSGGAFGQSPLSVGFEGGAKLNFHLSESFFIQLNYTFQLLQPEYPEPSDTISVPTRSTDMMHTGNVLFGFAL